MFVEVSVCGRLRLGLRCGSEDEMREELKRAEELLAQDIGTCAKCLIVNDAGSSVLSGGVVTGCEVS